MTKNSYGYQLDNQEGEENVEMRTITIRKNKRFFFKSISVIEQSSEEDLRKNSCNIFR